MTNTQQAVAAKELSIDEGRHLLDAAAHRWMNMSGEEFMAAYDEGAYDEDDRFAVQQVASYLPFARA